MRRVNINTEPETEWRLNYTWLDEGYRTLREAAGLIEAQRELEHMTNMILWGQPVTEVGANVNTNVILVSEDDYDRMEREWALDPDMIYYVYPDTPNVIERRAERHPKKVKVTYFID